MKKLLTLLAVSLCCLTGYAQTEEPQPPPLIDGPAGTILEFLRNGSNWVVAPYAIYDTGSKEGGGGIAGLVKVNEFLLTGLRLDYLKATDEVWMPSFTAQLQVPIHLGKLTLRPLLTTGVATPIAGRNDDNETVVGIFGTGLAVSINKNAGLFGHFEKWTGFDGSQIRGGFYWSF